MSIVKTSSGRWRARVKVGRLDVGSRTFDRKADAEDWERSQKRSLDLDEYVDPRAGKETVASAWERWQGSRVHSVSASTRDIDRAAFQALPAAIRNRPVASVHPSAFEAAYGSMLGALERSSVMRYRNSYGSFFGWATRQRLTRTNPARAVAVPKGVASKPKKEVFPFTLAELHAVHAALAEAGGQTAADMALIMGLTGLRPGEAIAIRVRDVQRLPMPAFRVSRSKTDGKPLRNVTKGGVPRSVPLLEDAWAIVEPLLGNDPDALLFPSEASSYRFLSNWKRDVHWSEHHMGRRVYDLRHTAATLWLQNGVDLMTASQWLGHKSTKLTADTYAHWMGHDSDLAAVARLNAALAGGVGGARTDSQETKPRRQARK